MVYIYTACFLCTVLLLIIILNTAVGAHDVLSTSKTWPRYHCILDKVRKKITPPQAYQVEVLVPKTHFTGTFFEVVRTLVFFFQMMLNRARGHARRHRLLAWARVARWVGLAFRWGRVYYPFMSSVRLRTLRRSNNPEHLYKAYQVVLVGALSGMLVVVRPVKRQAASFLPDKKPASSMICSTQGCQRRRHLLF